MDLESVKKHYITCIVTSYVMLYGGGDAASDNFGISNGVKQSRVISPLLFSLYIDELFLLLKESGMGCHVGLAHVSAFG